ncbi:MAG: SDR family oxidoreductase [Stappiaceae bacterium]
MGAELVRAFAAQKSRVGFIDLDEANSQSIASEAGEDIAFEICDLRDISALRNAFSSLAGRLGSADILVNNAARDDRHNWQDVTPEYFHERIATNLWRHFFALQAVAPGMIEAGGGRDPHISQ